MTVRKQISTKLLGKAIASFIEGQDIIDDVPHQEDFGSCNFRTSVGAIEVVDTSDPNNLMVVLDNGQLFTVRILAGEQ